MLSAMAATCTNTSGVSAARQALHPLRLAISASQFRLLYLRLIFDVHGGLDGESATRRQAAPEGDHRCRMDEGGSSLYPSLQRPGMGMCSGGLPGNKPEHRRGCSRWMTLLEPDLARMISFGSSPQVCQVGGVVRGTRAWSGLSGRTCSKGVGGSDNDDCIVLDGSSGMSMVKAWQLPLPSQDPQICRLFWVSVRCSVVCILLLVCWELLEDSGKISLRHRPDSTRREQLPEYYGTFLSHITWRALSIIFLIAHNMESPLDYEWCRIATLGAPMIICIPIQLHCCLLLCPWFEPWYLSFDSACHLLSCLFTYGAYSCYLFWCFF